MAEHEAAVRGDFVAVVTANRHISSCFYKLSVEFEREGAEALAAAQPGQFAQLDLRGRAVPAAEKLDEWQKDLVQRDIILRRPYSFCDINAREDKTIVDILYCALGPASLRMTTIRPGDKLNVIGPLGNGFAVDENKKTAILVMGGMGAPPLMHLAAVLGRRFTDIYTLAFVGAKTKTQLPFEGRIDEVSKEIGYPLHCFAKFGIESQVATDDGSLGFAGPVTQCLAEWLGRDDVSPDETIVYACGPEAMLAEVARITNDKNIDCRVSMERRMACGIGLCQSCAVECRAEGGGTDYKLCCKDGPVFDAKDVVFHKQEGHRL